MSQKRLHQVDVNTGEVLEDGYVAVLFPKRHNGFGKRWFAMNQDSLTVLKQVRRVEDFRVLMALLERLDFDNLIQLSQAEVADDLGMDKGSTSKAIKRLVELGALLEGPKIGVHRAYRLNPNFGWKGSAKSHHQALKDRLKLVAGGKR